MRIIGLSAVDWPNDPPVILCINKNITGSVSCFTHRTPPSRFSGVDYRPLRGLSYLPSRSNFFMKQFAWSEKSQASFYRVVRLCSLKLHARIYGTLKRTYLVTHGELYNCDCIIKTRLRAVGFDFFPELSRSKDFYGMRKDDCHIMPYRRKENIKCRTLKLLITFSRFGVSQYNY